MLYLNVFHFKMFTREFVQLRLYLWNQHGEPGLGREAVALKLLLDRRNGAAEALDYNEDDAF